jgi:membrane protein
VVKTTRAALRAFSSGNCPQFAAAIAYRVLLSLFPLALLVASIVGLLLQDDDRRAEVAADISDRVPLLEDAGIELDAALSTSPASLGILGAFGLVALLWSASGMMAALRVGLNAAWRVEKSHAYVRGKLIDLLLVTVVNVLVVVSVSLTLLTPLFRVPWDSLLAAGFVAKTIALFIGLASLYRLVPAVRPTGREAVAGASLAAIGLVILEEAFSVYATRFADYDAVYGSLATVVAFLIFVYMSASIVLFGAEAAHAWPESEIRSDDGPQRAATG